MRWLVFGVLLSLAKFGAGGALSGRASSVKDVHLDTKENDQPSQPVPETEVGSSKPPVTFEPECDAGSEWESNCHSCKCSDDGVALCTRQEFCDQPLADPIRCKPKTVIQRDCNSCICLENGLGLCTLKGCAKSSVSKKSTPTTVQGKECAAGSTWVSRCNRCSCSAEGLAVCNYDEGCPDMETLPNMRCAPGTHWRNDCNMCWCANGVPACTRKGCITFNKLETLKANKTSEAPQAPEELGTDHIEKHSVCKPAGTFYIGCNTCHCNFFGTDYSCTNKPCPLPEDVELFHELKMTKSSTSAKNKTQKIVCVANRMFIKDCNTCWCNDDGTGFFCTRKVCVPEIPDDVGGLEDKKENLRIIEKECRPDEVFELDCNMCRCNPDGKSFSCTRRACVDSVDGEENKNMTSQRKKRDTKSETPKQCQPGQEFRMDCNKCLCDDEGQDFSCTRNDCNAVNNHFSSASVGARAKRETSETENVTMECAAGSVFDKDCNVCRCTEDGRHAVCTVKRCPVANKEDNAAENAENTAADPEADPNFRCNPGEQFKRGCNDCSCSADGKSVFCTVMFCDQDVSSTNI